MSKKSTYPIDKHVGARLRMRRLIMKVSQQKLGHELGVTFQQVQKYEKGQTRLSAGRLQTIANVLKVPISFFFENGPVPVDRPKKGVIPPSMSFVRDFLADANGLNLCAAFTRIEDPKLRRSIVELVERIAEQR